MREKAALFNIITTPKAELHLHLEGSIRPGIAVNLAARHGIQLSAEEVLQRYAYGDFAGFLEAFKWVTSFLRAPEDYARLAADFDNAHFGQDLGRRVD